MQPKQNSRLAGSQRRYKIIRSQVVAKRTDRFWDNYGVY